MTFRIIYVLSLLLVGIITSSCGNREKLIYFQGEQSTADTTAFVYTPTFEVGDLLAIEISGTDPEIAAPFNQAEMVRQGTSQITSYANGIAATSGYLVGMDSTISLPIAGKIKTAI